MQGLARQIPNCGYWVNFQAIALIGREVRLNDVAQGVVSHGHKPHRLTRSRVTIDHTHLSGFQIQRRICLQRDLGPERQIGQLALLQLQRQIGGFKTPDQIFGKGVAEGIAEARFETDLGPGRDRQGLISLKGDHLGRQNAKLPRQSRCQLKKFEEAGGGWRIQLREWNDRITKLNPNLGFGLSAA